MITKIKAAVSTFETAALLLNNLLIIRLFCIYFLNVEKFFKFFLKVDKKVIYYYYL